MRNTITATALLSVAVSLAACAAPETKIAPSNDNSDSPRAAATVAAPLPSASSAGRERADELPVAATHGSGGASSPDAGPVMGPSNNSEKPDLDTPELDAAIEKAVAKAAAPNASAVERRAAADAYFKRGYVYYSAQNPRLYKFALGDFRRGLRYQPDNEEAQAIIEQIESIYRSMGRPIPPNGTD